MTIPSDGTGGPHAYLHAQIRWRAIEIVFWLALLLPVWVTPNYLSLASQVAITALFALSLDLILGPVAATLAPRGSIIALVKPQFEAGRGRTDHGVVRDPEIHREVLERTVESARRHGLGTRGVIASPITGPEGNREFLVHLGVGPDCAEILERIATVTEP